MEICATLLTDWMRDGRSLGFGRGLDSARTSPSRTTSAGTTHFRFTLVLRIFVGGASVMNQSGSELQPCNVRLSAHGVARRYIFPRWRLVS